MSLVHFDGSTYSHSLDHDRLETQLGRVHDLMADGRWRTPDEVLTGIGSIAGGTAGVTARLRDLRKDRFGSHVVESRRRARCGLWEYRMTERSIPGEQLGLFSRRLA